MRRKLPLLLSALFVVFSVAACEGPIGPQGERGPQGEQGPAGQDGEDGLPGENALNTCSDCHAADATIVAIEQQFELSPHGFPQFTLYDRDGCNACHSHNGFIAANTDAEFDAGTGTASMNCRTCHQIHSDVDGDGDFEVGDFALTTTDPVQLLVLADQTAADSVFDFSFAGDAAAGSNLCASCHKARAEDAWPDADAPMTQMFALGNHYDFHHGPQANVFVAQLPESIQFGDYAYPSDAYGPHTESSCLGCHMGFGILDDDGNPLVDPAPTPTGELSHTYQAGEEACAACHTEGFFGESTQSETMASLEGLGNCLANAGVIDGWDPETWEFHGVVAEHPEPYVAAFLVFAGLVEDGSWGVHQPRYAPNLAEEALGFMTTQVPGCDVAPVL